MANIKVIWTELLGRQLQTATGATFKVVRVSATHVAVRPQRGTRDYALSISQELEPAVAVYAAGNLPPPAELAHLGIRPVLLSYAWGILKAVVQDKIACAPFGEPNRATSPVRGSLRAWKRWATTIGPTREKRLSFGCRSPDTGMA